MRMNLPITPPDFDCNMYRLMNKDLLHLSDVELSWHYNLHGMIERRNYKQAMGEQVYYPAKSGGVNLLGYVNNVLGLATTCRMLAQSLKTLEIDFNLNEYPLPYKPYFFLETSNESQYGINIICINPDIGYETISPIYFKDKKNIGLIFWELEKLPDMWIEALQLFDEIWVGSKFNESTVRLALPEKKVFRLPVSPEHIVPLDKTACKMELGIAPDTFLCLFIFDYRSDVSRKNPQGAIAAFKRAFPNNEACTLVVKTHHFPQTALSRMQMEIGNDARIIFWNEEISSARKDILMNACDLYISLHRSEGLGMTMMEALLLGKPTVSTAYSGNMDFCDPSWTALVKYEMTEVKRESLYYTAGSPASQWAEPDLEDAASKIRDVFLNYDFHLEKAAKGKAWIEKEYSSQALNDFVHTRLNAFFATE